MKGRLRIIVGSLAATALAVPAVAAQAGAATPAAKIIGAHSLNWAQDSATFGPFKDDRIFYPGNPPASFAGTAGDKLPAGVTAVISYKTPTTNVASFVSSIPANRPVIITWHHEPEHDMAASAFVSEFEQQSNLIRAQHKSNVRVAMIASTYQYVNGRSGYGCAYIPPASYVDMYTADAYQPTPTGLASDPQWNRWVTCTSGYGKNRGITEYGLGTGKNDAVREQTLATDDAYLKQHFPNLQIWSYWNVDDSYKGPLRDWRLLDSATQNEWQRIEQGN